MENLYINNVLLIANKGKLGFEICSKLQKGFNPKIIYLDKNNTKKTFSKFLKHSLKKKFKIVIYIGGETKNENLMENLNFLFPFRIAEFCEKNCLSFIYLSSLSVFGLPETNIINEGSKRQSIDIYSKTKNLLDNSIKQKLPYLDCISIMPGSIINPQSKHSLIEKIKKIVSNPFIFNIFKIFGIRGTIHLTSTSLLGDLILDCCKNINLDKAKKNTFKSIICSFDYQINDILKYIYNLNPKFLIGIKSEFILRLKFLIPKAILKKFLFLLSNIYYKSNQRKLKKPELKDFIIK